MSTDTPAILGGPPAFPDGLRLLRPTLPPLEALRPGLESAFATGMVTKGPALAEYERRVAEHLGVAHAIAVSSCTAGLMLVYDGLRPEGAPRAGGAAPGGAPRPQAVMPSFTFMATAMAAVWAGLEPVFADIDPDTWCLSPAAAEAALTSDTALVAPVHVFGVPADTDAFGELGRRRGVPVVYDAAHGFGALRDGRPLGAAGLANVFSTSPTKLLITGEGGVVATDDDALAERVVVGREYGNPGTYDALFPGLNARLPEASALLGLEGLGLLEPEAERRNELAGVYRELLGGLPGLAFQRVRPQDRPSFKDFSVRVRAAEFGLTRDELAAALDAEGVDTRAYYVPPVHRLTAFAATGPAFDERLPETARLCDEVITLPAYGRLETGDVERIAACMIALHEQAPRVRRGLAPA